MLTLKPNITQQTATPDYKILRKKKSAMTAWSASMHPLRVAPPYNQAYKKGVAKIETPKHDLINLSLGCIPKYYFLLLSARVRKQKRTTVIIYPVL